jgi:GrpB-like predicted nucleotidyltransferase (UPF0157 family)
VTTPFSGGRVQLHGYDPAWPDRFLAEERLIRGALGARALLVEHTGSTSVPGLAAKPIIDITLTVRDSAEEATYVPDLEGVGYHLHIREPDWYEHRLLKDAAETVNLHVFTTGSVEVDRMIRFRDILRADPVARAEYESAKRALAERTWGELQEYADAKTDVVARILAEEV